MRLNRDDYKLLSERIKQLKDAGTYNDYKLWKEIVKLKTIVEELQQSKDHNDNSNNDQNSESSFKHMNAIPDTTEELTFKPRKVGVSKVEAWNGNQVALETPKGRGNADTSYSLYTEQEARDLANALYSASNYLRSQK